MNEKRWEWWGGASGFAVLAVGAAATAFERGVPTGGSVRELTDFYALNRDALLAQSLLFMIGSGIFLCARNRYSAAATVCAYDVTQVRNGVQVDAGSSPTGRSA